MKKVKIALLALAAIVLVLPACKKGPDDPFISFKSRDGRLMRGWNLTAIAETVVDGSSTPALTTTTTYNGSSLVTSYSDGSPTTTATGTYTMTIGKNGVVTYTETYTAPGATSATVASGTGTWMWWSSSKSKEFLLIDGASNLFSGGMYFVDELKSKELILEVNSSSTSTSGGITIPKSTTAKYTFEEQ